MRSRWVGRLFGQADGGSGVGKPRQDVPQVSRAIKDSRVHSGGTLPARPRICLGIGDGRVHRQ